MGSLNNHDKKASHITTSFHHPFTPSRTCCPSGPCTRITCPGRHPTGTTTRNPDGTAEPPRDPPSLRGVEPGICRCRFFTGERMTIPAMHVISFITWPPQDGMICHEIWQAIHFACEKSLPKSHVANLKGFDYSPPFITQESLIFLGGKSFWRLWHWRNAGVKPLGFHKHPTTSATVMNPSKN